MSTATQSSIGLERHAAPPPSRAARPWSSSEAPRGSVAAPPTARRSSSLRRAGTDSISPHWSVTSSEPAVCVRRRPRGRDPHDDRYRCRPSRGRSVPDGPSEHGGPDWARSRHASPWKREPSASRCRRACAAPRRNRRTAAGCSPIPSCASLALSCSTRHRADGIGVAARLVGTHDLLRVWLDDTKVDANVTQIQRGCVSEPGRGPPATTRRRSRSTPPAYT
jgi:hypothetical protein